MRSSTQIALTGIILGLFAVVGTGLVALTEWRTAPRIAANERAALLATLDQVLPARLRDNDLFADTLQIRDPADLNRLGRRDPITVYRARRDGTITALALTVEATEGYSGRIRLLVGIRSDGRLLGVRVLAHNETPGLGDMIELARSDWITAFDGRALGDPDDDGWRVKKDGGVFDQFTGATITPRAVVQAVHSALLYFRDHHSTLLAPRRATDAGPADAPLRETP